MSEPIEVQDDLLQIVQWDSDAEQAKRLAEEQYDFYFKYLHPELAALWKRTMDISELRRDQGVSGYLIRAKLVKKEAEPPLPGWKDNKMSLPPISHVAWFLHQHPNLKEYLQQKKVDLQRIENIEVAGRHMTALLLDGITIGEATITLTMQGRQQQFFTVSAKEVQKLLTPLQG